MNFEFSADQEAIRDAAGKICARFGDDYWLARDGEGAFPEDFHHAFAEAGWLGGLHSAGVWRRRFGRHGSRAADADHC
jgi:alkylation response protein AidB-like acyl-CoA dehydrogenase